MPRLPTSALFPYTTLFRSLFAVPEEHEVQGPGVQFRVDASDVGGIALRSEGAAKRDRKSTRLNSSHANISYAVFCLKKKPPILAGAAIRCYIAPHGV